MNLFAPVRDPVVVKELGGMSRRGRTYLGRIFYVTLAGILVYAVAAPVLDGGRVPSTSEYALLGRRLFTAFTALQMVFLPLAAAIAASDLLHREARLGTLQILLLTPLGPDRIVAGKWRAVMIETLTLALAGAPGMAIAVYLGGAGVEDLLWSFFLPIVMSGVAAAMAIYYSLRDRTVVEAAFRSYLVLQFSCLPYFVFMGFATTGPFIGRSRGGGGWEIGALPCWIHPYCAWAAAANPARSGELASHGWIGATLASTWFCRRYLRLAADVLRPSRQGSPFLDGPVHGGPAKNPEIHASAPAGPVWERWPLLWKEYSTRPVRLPASPRVTLGILFAVLMLISLASGPLGALVPLYLFGGFTLVLALAIGSGHFAREKERRGFEMLLSTPLRASHVVGTKLVSGLLGAEPAILLLFLTIAFGWLLSGARFSSDIPLTVGAFLLFSYILASALSLRARSYRSAFVAAAAVSGFLLIGIPILMNVLEGTALGALPAVEFASYALHPLRVHYLEHPVAHRAWIVPANLALYAAASLLLVGDMIRRYRSMAEGR